MSVFFYLTPTITLMLSESFSPLHMERGGSFSEYRRVRWGEVEIL
jgi:hypothetical protein